MLDAPQLGEFIKSRFTRLAFRLETLDAYEVPSDGGDPARYLRGEPDPDPERKGAWLTRLREERAAGKARQRVHVLTGPLTNYLRYECEWGYVPNVAVGEDVRILDLAERPRPAELDIDHDFWLLDDEVAIRMYYDDAKRFTGAEVVAEAELPRYRAARDAALAAAEPFTDYWQRHLEYHRSVWQVMTAPARDKHSRLVTQLRELRSAAGLSGIEAGRRAGISQSKISKIENKALRPSPDDVRALCKVYGAPPDLADWLVQLTESLRTQTIEPRRVTLSRGAPAMQQRIRKLEEAAQLLRSFQPSMVIGLLQTEAYARLVFSVSQTGSRLDRAVAERMRRQKALRKKVPKAVLIMTEGALRWHAGSPQLMIEQLEAISAASRLPNVQVGVIPYTTPVTVFPRHGFHLYDSDAVIVGTETGTATIVDPEDIARYESMFADLEQVAVTGDAARDVLARVSDDYRRL